MAVDLSMSVLVVDDYSTMIRIIRNLLKQLGFENIDDASDGSAALNKMRGKKYGLVISDWNMEPMTGYDLLLTDVILSGTLTGKQVADEAAERRPGLKVLFMSGYTENAIVHHGRLDPGVMLLSKPFRATELARMVRSAIAGGQTSDA